MSQSLKSLVAKLGSLANKKNVEGIARFGISSVNTLGVSMPVLRKIGKEIGKNHALAQELWDGG